MRYGMLIELDKCIGCKACVSACKERWDSGRNTTRDWVHEYESGSRDSGLHVTFYPGLCMQCDGHPCTTECPTGATWADENGVVQVDPDLCIGCGNCMDLCPYGARQIDPEKRIAEKCNMCSPYVARGEQPACVQACLADCRHFGDLEDSTSSLAQLIRKREAKPLVTPEVNVGPNVYFAGDEERKRLLQNGVVKQPESTLLTQIWQQGTRPAARYVAPALVAVVGAGGLLINLRTRVARNGGETAKSSPLATSTSSASGVGPAASMSKPSKLPRHRFGMRFLHWFNAASWVFLLVTGTALMATPAFALFGTEFPEWLANGFGGAANLLWAHVVWGLVWAAIIVPFFLYFKRGGLEALEEIRLNRDDLRWLLLKPKALLDPKVKLPPQGKYNAGQKLFAMSALVGTATIIASGLIMVFHLGSAGVVAAAVLVHKLAILLALVGLAVHITMAAILAEERPSLRAMISGYIDRHHAEKHSARWVQEHHASTAPQDPSSQENQT